MSDSKPKSKSKSKSKAKSTAAKEWHGRTGAAGGFDKAPRLVAECALAVRADQGNSTRADEFLDAPDVLDAKCAALAAMMLAARQTTLYTGAGLSKTAGIPDYASRAANSLVAGGRTLQSPLDARPTPAHRVIAALERRDLIKAWVQQNHDSLGQKAGFPNHKVNSIHGDWYDPSNPVVQFSGSLRDDLFGALLAAERAADLVLVLGTSLSGMNADRVAESAARRCDLRAAQCPPSAAELEEAECFGTVIINLQRTRLDSKSTLRIWATLDTVFEKLAEQLELAADEWPEPPLVLPLPLSRAQSPTRFELPRYDAATGLRLPAAAPDSPLALDLSVGAKVRIAHPDAPNHGVVGEVTGVTREGHWHISLKRPGKLTRVYTLGRWWIGEALTGKGLNVPVVPA